MATWQLWQFPNWLGASETPDPTLASASRSQAVGSQLEESLLRWRAMPTKPNHALQVGDIVSESPGDFISVHPGDFVGIRILSNGLPFLQCIVCC